MSSAFESSGSRQPQDNLFTAIFVCVLAALAVAGGVMTYLYFSPALTEPPGRIASGSVVDERTGRGIPGATVLVRSYPERYGLGDPRFLLTQGAVREVRRTAATTDSSGRFCVPYAQMQSAALSVVAPGYVTKVEGPFAGESLRIELRAPSVSAQQITHGGRSLIPIDGTSRSLWIDVDSSHVTTDSSGAEFEFIVHSLRDRKFALRTVVPGGLLGTGGGTLATWEEGCQAPEEGYVTETSLDRNLVFYFRLETRDPHRYGRIRVEAGVPTVDPSHGYVEVRFTVNPTGTREVCAEPPLGEDQVVEDIAFARSGRERTN